MSHNSRKNKCMIKILLIFTFVSLFYFYRVHGAEDFIMHSRIGMNSINNEINTDLKDKKINFTLRNNIFAYAELSSPPVRNIILVTDENNQIIYYHRDCYWGQTSPYDYTNYSVDEEFLLFNYDIKVPLEPSLLDRIDGKIIQTLARFLVLLE